MPEVLSIGAVSYPQDQARRQTEDAQLCMPRMQRPLVHRLPRRSDDGKVSAMPDGSASCASTLRARGILTTIARSSMIALQRQENAVWQGGFTIEAFWAPTQ